MQIIEKNNGNNIRETASILIGKYSGYSGFIGTEINRDKKEVMVA